MSKDLREDRFEDLIQRQLDDELSPAELVELAEILAADPAARRRREEYVALEGLLFAVGTTERVDPAREPTRASPERASRAPSRALSMVAPAVLALLLGLVILSGIAAPPKGSRSAPRPSPTADAVAARESLRITDLSEGHLAVALPSENPNVQIIWLYQTEPRPEERTP